MPKKAVEIKLFDRAATLIDKELKSRQLPGHFRLRMQIVIQAWKGRQNKDIAAEFGCSLSTVRRWRKRWADHYTELQEYAKGLDGAPVGEKALLDKIKEILSDEQRPGTPFRITETEVDRIIALACQSPAEYGLPFTHWTHRRLSGQAKEMGIEVSASQVGRFLKKRFTAA